jgi:hypothetical protein
VNKLAVIVLLIGLAACSRKKEEEGREPAQTAAPGPVVGSAAPRAPAPATPPAGSAAADNAAAGGGLAAGGGAAGGSTLTSYNAACTDKTPGLPPLGCDVGQIDGCTGGVTSVHVCVPKDAKAGTPCAQQPALTCPTGQGDACLHDPPQATTHVCVIVPKSTP